MHATIVSAYAPKITNRPTDGDNFYQDLDSNTPRVNVCVCLCVTVFVCVLVCIFKFFSETKLHDQLKPNFYPLMEQIS